MNLTEELINKREFDHNLTPLEIETLEREVFLMKIGSIFIITGISMLFGIIPFLWYYILLTKQPKISRKRQIPWISKRLFRWSIYGNFSFPSFTRSNLIIS